MFKNYMKIALRNINKNKGISFIKIIGLAIGMASFILIMLYVQYEFSFDDYHSKSDRIYRIVQNNPGESYNGNNTYATTPSPLAQTLMDEYPEVENATRIDYSANVLFGYEQKSFIEKKLYYSDKEIFKIFDFEFVKGDPNTVFDNLFSIVITEEIAIKYFGEEDPIGKTILVNESRVFTVTGLIKKFPQNSHFIVDMISSFDTYMNINNREVYNSWTNNNHYTYFTLFKETDHKTFASKMPALLEKYLFSIKDEKYLPAELRKSYIVQPLNEIHLYSSFNFDISKNNDINSIYILVSIAFFVLLIACINYINLTTAISSSRGKEVGIRKVVGANRQQLIVQFFSESIILTFFSIVISFALFFLILPEFNSFVNRDLSLNLFGDFYTVILIAGLTIFVGTIAGLYPALYISSFKPIAILRGESYKKTKTLSLRNILVTGQFILTITLIICTIVISDQMDYINNKELGYNKENIIVIGMRDTNARKNIALIKEELIKNTNILAAAGSNHLPNMTGSQTTIKIPGKNDDISRLSMYYANIDFDFIDLYGIDIINGRNFFKEMESDNDGVFLINETTAKALEWDSPVGKEMYRRSNKLRKVVGVMKDFHNMSLHQPIEKMFYYLDIKNATRYLSIKISNNNIPETLKFIEKTFSVYSPNYPFEYRFFSDIFNSTYEDVNRFYTIFNVFSILTIFVACLGLFGLSSFTVEQRTKEIGVRKILGASSSNIVSLLSREFIKWIAISNIVAWPIGYYFMNRWLSDFTYKIDIGADIFLLSAVIAIGIALFTVSFLTIKAALTNPVESLRYE